MESSSTYSAFVIIPDDKKEKFVWVIDLPDTREKTPKKKFPGGGVQTGETPEMAAGKEVSEEVGLRIVDPSTDRRLVEIHKRSLINGNIPHKDLFFEGGCPLEGTNIEAGKEISEAGWSSQKEIVQKIERGEFYPNHAAAFLWLMTRDIANLDAGEHTLLSSILDSRRSSWRIHKKMLVICYDPLCNECARKIMPKPAISPPEVRHVPDMSERIPVFSENTPCTTLKYVSIFSDKFTSENSIFLAPTGARWTYQLPREQFSHNLEIRERLDSLKCKSEFLFSFSLFDSYVAVCRPSSSTIVQEWEKISLDKNPNFFMKAVEWQTVLRAVDDYNKLSGTKKIYLHHGWLNWKNQDRLA